MNNIVDDELYEVEKILSSRVVKGKKQYLLKWKGYPLNKAKWTNEEDLLCDFLLEEFKKSEKLKAQNKRKRSSSGMKMTLEVPRQTAYRDSDPNLSDSNDISLTDAVSMTPGEPIASDEESSYEPEVKKQMENNTSGGTENPFTLKLRSSRRSAKKPTRHQNPERSNLPGTSSDEHLSTSHSTSLISSSQDPLDSHTSLITVLEQNAVQESSGNENDAQNVPKLNETMDMSEFISRLFAQCGNVQEENPAPVMTPDDDDVIADEIIIDDVEEQNLLGSNDHLHGEKSAENQNSVPVESGGVEDDVVTVTEAKGNVSIVEEAREDSADDDEGLIEDDEPVVEPTFDNGVLQRDDDHNDDAEMAARDFTNSRITGETSINGVKYYDVHFADGTDYYVKDYIVSAKAPGQWFVYFYDKLKDEDDKKKAKRH